MSPQLILLFALIASGCFGTASKRTNSDAAASPDHGVVPGDGDRDALSSSAGRSAADEVAVPVSSETDDRPLTRGDLHRIDLKQAKLWARIDELEDELKRTRERMRVLERGLVLGLVPPEIQNDHSPARKPKALEVEGENRPLPKKSSGKGSAKRDPASNDPTGSNLALAPDEASGGGAPARGKASNLVPEQESEYQRRLAQAQEHFRAGRYGRAIAEYSALGKDFGERIEGGAHKYWIALSWYHLKEYQTSYNHFVEFLTEFPMSSLVPRAKLDLGRVEVRMGLKEKAMGRFKEIMRDYPHEDAAEMARMEAANLEKNL